MLWRTSDCCCTKTLNTTTWTPANDPNAKLLNTSFVLAFEWRWALWIKIIRAFNWGANSLRAFGIRIASYTDTWCVYWSLADTIQARVWTFAHYWANIKDTFALFTDCIFWTFSFMTSIHTKPLLITIRSFSTFIFKADIIHRRVTLSSLTLLAR